VTVAAGFLPWSFFLPRALASWWGRRGAALKRDPVGALLIVWSILIFVFFSFSHSKLAGYILPIFPALALLVAAAFDDVFDVTPAPRWIAGGLLGLTLFFMAALVLLKWPTPPAFLAEEPGRRIALQSGALALTLGVSVFVLVGVWGMRRTSACFAGVLLVQIFILSNAAILTKELDPFLSAKGIALTLGERASAQARIVTYGISFENRLQSLLFYTRRRLTVLGDPGELALGLRHDPQSADWFVPEEAAQGALLTLPFNTWIVTDDEHWKTLDAAGQAEHFALVERQGSLLLLQKIE